MPIIHRIFQGFFTRYCPFLGAFDTLLIFFDLASAVAKTSAVAEWVAESKWRGHGGELGFHTISWSKNMEVAEWQKLWENKIRRDPPFCKVEGEVIHLTIYVFKKFSIQTISQSFCHSATSIALFHKIKQNYIYIFFYYMRGGGRTVLPPFLDSATSTHSTNEINHALFLLSPRSIECRGTFALSESLPVPCRISSSRSFR